MTSRDSAVGPEPRVRSGARRDGHGSDLAEECDVVEAVPPLDDAVSAEAQEAFPAARRGVRGGGLRPASPHPPPRLGRLDGLDYDTVAYSCEPGYRQLSWTPGCRGRRRTRTR